MKIFVTGATGYFGRELALHLARTGNEVHALVRDAASSYIPADPAVRIFEGNFSNEALVKNAMSGCTWVFHTAAEVTLGSPTVHESNVKGTENILRAARDLQVQKVVFTSTCATLADFAGHPVTEADPRQTKFNNVYEQTKFDAERLVALYGNGGVHAVTVHLSKIFGPGIDRRKPGMMTSIKDAMRSKPVFVPGPQPVLSNFVFMEDAVRGHVLAAQHGNNGDNYIIGGENVSYNHFFQLAARANNKKDRIIPVPLAIARALAWAGMTMNHLGKRKPVVTPAAVRELYRLKTFSSEKAIRDLGYRVTPLEEALTKTALYLKNHGEL